MIAERSIAAGIGSLALLSGRSDPQAASEANFRAVLEPVVRDVFCTMIDPDRIELVDEKNAGPFPLIASALTSEPSRSATDRYTLLRTATEAGLLTRSRSTAMGSTRYWSSQPTEQSIESFMPTREGERFFRTIGEEPSGQGRPPSPAVCVATGEIVDIVRWSEPAQLLGMTVSEVTVRYRGIDPIPIATPEERAKIEQPQERKWALLLANDGWQVARR